MDAFESRRDPRIGPFLQTGRGQNKRAQDLFIQAYAFDHDFAPLRASGAVRARILHSLSRTTK
jgi:hypothetical protein